MRRTSIESYVANKELIVVMPDTHRCFYTNTYSGHKYYDFIAHELPAFCAHFFPVSDRREDTFAAGLSMGGYGAFKLGLSQPDRFAAVASLSGVVDVVQCAADLDPISIGKCPLCPIPRRRICAAAKTIFAPLPTA